jgi:hypothetical protein
MDDRAGTSKNEGTGMRVTKKIGLALSLTGTLAVGCITWQPAFAEDEFRVGLMLQIPIGGSERGDLIHFPNTRIGIKIQYAALDDTIKRNETVIDRVYLDGVLQSSTTRSSDVITTDGDKVSGAQAYLLVTPFNRKWNLSGGIDGFSGSNNIQGALGLGYDPTFGGVYVKLGAQMPYSELGVRFNLRYIDYLAGINSLSGFSPKTVWKEDNITYYDTFNTSPPSEDGGDTGSE